MKQILTTLCWPILRFFEVDEEPPGYKSSHRITLNVVGALFMLLSLGSAAAGYTTGGPGSFIPVIIFFCVGLVSVVVGSLGSNGAVSKLWGTR